MAPTTTTPAAAPARTSHLRTLAWVALCFWFFFVATNQQINVPSASPNNNNNRTDAYFAGGDEPLPRVSLVPGIHKYVLLSAKMPPLDGTADDFWVVVSADRKYHQQIAQPWLRRIDQAGYSGPEVRGGGRIELNVTERRVFIYGYSKRYGPADHAKAKSIVDVDPRFEMYNVTWSYKGY